MSNFFAQLEWLRPEILWLLLAIPFLVFFSWRAYQRSGQWQQVVDEHLLSFMLTEQPKKQLWPLLLFSLLLILLIGAAAGPSWSKQEVPVFRGKQSRVILLDLSLSMDAIDIKPSRLTRAKHKVLDLLENSKEGETGLVVYAGDAFIISPLTNDANTISTMVPVLATGLMPVLGSEPNKGMAKAIELLNNSKTRSGHIIWITDGIDEIDVDMIGDELSDLNYQVSVLTVGTEEGAPINLPDGKGFLKDRSGNIVMPSLNMTHFNRLSNRYPVNLVSLSANGSDIETIMAYENIEKADAEKQDQMIQNKLDQGYLVLLFALPLFVYAFRNARRLPGISLVILFFILSPHTHANLWDDLWLTPDQQAQKALAKGDAEKAAQLFNDKNWKASAAYRAENYKEAESIFSKQNTVTGKYNLGNSLALQGHYDEAIAAYEKVLELDSSHQDAAYNKKLIEQIKEQEEQKQEQDQSEQNDDNSEQQEQQSEQQQQQENDQKESSDQSQQQQQQLQNEQQQSLEEQKDSRSEQEKQQALEQWLRQIPDDPGGLLRRKMYREYQKRGRENRNVQKIW